MSFCLLARFFFSHIPKTDYQSVMCVNFVHVFASMDVFTSTEINIYNMNNCEHQHIPLLSIHQHM